VVLTASSAGYVRDGAYANTDLSSDPTLVVRKGPAGQSRETFLTFDLSRITRPIHSAKLRLVGRLSQSDTKGVSVRAYAVTATPPKGALKWNNRPQSSASAFAAATISGTTRRTYEWDLTAFLLAQKAAGKRTVTVALKGASATDAAALFDGPRAAVTAPRLVVT
jgi:hypothetical protein